MAIGPGPESFTSALIWSLSNIVKGRARFTSEELLSYIIRNAPGFSRRQRPIVTGRNPRRRVILGPLGSKDDQDRLETPSEDKAATSQTKIVNKSGKESFDLRFFTYDNPTDQHVRELAAGLKEMMGLGRIPAQRIAWQGIRQTLSVKLDSADQSKDSPLGKSFSQSIES